MNNYSNAVVMEGEEVDNSNIDPILHNILRRRCRSMALERNKYMTLSRMVIAILSGVIIASSCTIISLVGMNKNLANELVETKNNNAMLKMEASNMESSYSELTNTLAQLSKVDVELDNQNAVLISDNKALKAKIDQYEEREELFDKYEYAIIRQEDGTRTDIKYSDIENIRQIAKEKGMSEDSIDLVLSLAMTESRGTEKAKNSSSTAKGLGQILDGTGKYVYENLLDKGKYNSSVAYDSKTNLEMMLALVDYLDDNANGNVNKVLNNYRGTTAPAAYKNKVNSYLANNDLSLNTLNIKEDD